MNFLAKFNNKQFLKILIIFSFILYSITVLYLVDYGVTGYFLSIYDNIPFDGLILINFMILIGIIIILFSHSKKNSFWKLGLLLIFLCNFLILILPYVAGYAYSSHTDHLTHIGLIKDILNVGSLSLNTGMFTTHVNSNFYPLTHIIVAEISLLTTLSVETIAFLIGPFFYAIFILYTYIFTKKISKKYRIFSILSATVLFCYFFKEIFAMGFAFLTYPLIFYIYYNYRKRKNMNFAVITIVIISSMTFFHPIAAIILTVILFFYEILNLLISVFIIKTNKYQISFTLILFSLIMIILWMWQISWLWEKSIMNILNLLNNDLLVKPFIDNASENFNKVGLNLVQIFELFVRMYGSIALFLLLSIISSFKIIYSKKFESYKNRYVYFLSIVFIISVVLWIFDLIMPLTSLSSGRFIWIVIPLFPFFVGISLYKIINFDLINSKKLKYFIVFCLIGFASINSVLVIHPNPEIHLSNIAVSNSEIDGADWIITNSKENIQTLSVGHVPIYRYEGALNGAAKVKIDREDRKLIGEHFNYTEFNQIGDIYNETKYMILRTDFLINIHTGMYKNMNKFNLDDFKKLENDPSVSKIYGNGNMDIMFII
jgi:hypothetical protein